MKNSDTYICSVIETRMNEITEKMNKTDSIFEAGPLNSELRIQDIKILVNTSNASV